jgi:hypothetical protein
MQRIFSDLSIKTISEDERVIEGIATTPRADRMGDIVESNGAEFSLPIPFLLDHNHTEAVGEVELAQVTSTGIRFRARIKKIPEPGHAKDLVDRAWQLIKNGLRRFVSIGFRPIEFERLASGGLRFTAWEWLELSAVTVPAQPDAAITGMKAHASTSDSAIEARKDKIRRDALYRDVETTARRKRLGIVVPVKLTPADMAAAYGRKRESGQVVRLRDGVNRSGRVVRLDAPVRR